MPALENEFLKVEVSAYGAEMTSLYNKTTGFEHLWQGDSAFWGFRSPILFPVVGSCLEDKIYVNGESYPMNRHGFVRNSAFTVLDSEPTHLKLSMEFSEETLKSYPYKFTIQVLYDLFDSELRISYKVINQDDKTIYFSIGAHPAFNIPFFTDQTYEDFFLEFELDEVLYKHLGNDRGLFNGKTEPVQLENRILPLSQHLFRDGAMVFKQLSSREVKIRNHQYPGFISVSFPHFDSLALWAPYGAPFVCIEPWIGYADSEGPAVEINQKPGIKSLEHGHVFEVDYTIGIS